MIYDINGNEVVLNAYDELGGVGENEENAIISASRYNTYVSGWAGSETYKKNNLTFAVISDIHADSAMLNAFITYVNEHSDYLDFAIVLGDNVESRGGAESTSWYDEALDNSTIPIYATIGNHDVRGADLTTAVGKVFGKIKAKNWLTSADFGNINDGYWYKDFSSYGVRVIGLNDYDNADALSGSSSSYGEAKSESKWYDTAQLQWLADTLFSTPSNYAVLLFSHQPYATDEPLIEHTFTKKANNSHRLESGTAIDGEPIGDILDAFINGTSINRTYNPTSAMSSYFSKTAIVSKDFSSRGTGKFVGHICGHEHVAYIATHPTHTNLKDIVVISGTNNIYQRQQDDIPPSSENNFYVIGIDTEWEKINLVKIGGHVTIDLRGRFVGKLDY